MKELGKNAQKELIAKISDTIEKLEREQYWLERGLENIQEDIKKKKKRKKIIRRWDYIIGCFSDLDKLIIKLSNLDEENEMIAYYLLSMPEWIEKQKELRPKVLAFVESGLWYRLFKKEVTLKLFKSKSLRLLSLDSILANKSVTEENEDVTIKDPLKESAIAPNPNAILQSMGLQTENNGSPAIESKKKKRSIKEANL